MAQPIPSNGKWITPVKPSPASSGADVLTLPTTGNSNLDQILRQLADHANATRRELQRVADQHAHALYDSQQQAPKILQDELSTKGSAPLNIHGLLGTPSVLQQKVGSNSGAALNLQGNVQVAGDLGPASGQVFNWIPLPDGTFIPKFK